MRIVWDEPKRLANIDKHQIDLRDVTEDFINEGKLYPARLGRIAVIGMHKGHLMTAIVERLGNEAVAVISFATLAERNGGSFGPEEVHIRTRLHQTGLGRCR